MAGPLRAFRHACIVLCSGHHQHCKGISMSLNAHVWSPTAPNAHFIMCFIEASQLSRRWLAVASVAAACACSNSSRRSVLAAWQLKTFILRAYQAASSRCQVSGMMTNAAKLLHSAADASGQTAS